MRFAVILEGGISSATDLTHKYDRTIHTFPDKETALKRVREVLPSWDGDSREKAEHDADAQIEGEREYNRAGRKFREAHP